MYVFDENLEKLSLNYPHNPLTEMVLMWGHNV